MTGEPRVAVVTPVFNQVEFTLRFLAQFQAVRYGARQLILVDDGSTDGTPAAVARHFPEVTLLQGDGSLWWAGATNLGVRHALAHGFDYVLTINNDTRPHPDFLGRLVQTAAAHPRTIVGSRINFASEPSRVWAVGSIMAWATGTLFQLRDNGKEERAVLARRRSPCPAQALTGCGTLVPAACYREVGLYDAARYPQYHADSEFVLRAARKGWRALVDLQAVVWNDAQNTTARTVSNWRDLLLTRRSAVYWRPILSIHFQYCPAWLLLPSLLQHYAWFLWYHEARIVRAKRAVRRLAARRLP